MWVRRLTVFASWAAALVAQPSLYSETARLTAVSGGADDAFGAAVAVHGDTVVVGAPGDHSGGVFRSGSLFVYRRTEGGWRSMFEQANLHVSRAEPRGSLGVSVALTDEVIVAAAPGERAAFVFVRPATGWVSAIQTARLTAPEMTSPSSIAVQGDIVVVGDPTADFGNGQVGGAFVFERPVGGWRETTAIAVLRASDPSLPSNFGVSVGLDGVVVVGADGAGATGAAYVFEPPAGGWVSATETAKLVAVDGRVGDRFGGSVAIDDDTIVAGASGVDLPGVVDCGAVHVFESGGGSWGAASEVARLTASQPLPGSGLGSRVASTSGTVLALGFSPYCTSGGFVFHESPQGWTGSGEQALLLTSDGVGLLSVAAEGTTYFAGRSTAAGLGVESMYVFESPYVGASADPRIVALSPESVPEDRCVDYRIEVVGARFCGVDTVHVGGVSFPLVAEPGGGHSFTLPPGLLAGRFPVSVSGVRGASNEVTLDVVKRAPVLATISPSGLPNYGVQRVAQLTGSGLDCVDQVIVGGLPLPILGRTATELDFLVPNGFEIATHAVQVTHPAGPSNVLSFEVSAVTSPAYVVPAQIAPGASGLLDAYTERGWTVVHLLQPGAPVPSVWPGVVSLGIGNAFGSLHQWAVVMASVGGRAPATLSVPASMPIGTVLSVEILAVDPAGPVLPLPTSGASQLVVR